MRATIIVKTAALCLLVSLAAGIAAAGEDAVTVEDYSKLPANTWVLIHREDNSGGKAFARLVLADNVDQLYLWGTGGKKPVRNVFLRYELESFAPMGPEAPAILKVAAEEGPDLAVSLQSAARRDSRYSACAVRGDDAARACQKGMTGSVLACPP